MKSNHLLLLLLTVCMSLPFSGSAQREFEMKEGDTTYIMKEYFFCILTAGEKRNDFDSLQLAKLQEAHLANINRLAEEGKLHIAGPFGDDGDWRGILVLDAKNIKEAEELVKSDPAVQAGRLSYIIHPWWAAKGSSLK